MMNKEVRFWNWFIKNQFELFKQERFTKENEDLFLKLKRNLKRINELLTYEISGLKENGKKEFTISADGRMRAFKSVINLVNYAPINELLNWEIKAFRQKDEKVGSIEFNNGFKISIQELLFNYTVEKEGKISLRIYCDNLSGFESNYELALPILLDSLLGEYDAVTKIKHLNLLEKESSYDSEKFEMNQLLTEIEKLKEKHGV